MSKKIKPQFGYITNLQSVPYETDELIRVSNLIKDELLEYFYEDGKTLYELFMRGVRISPNKPCCGWRMGPDLPYIWITYNQVLERSKRVGSGLITLGAKPDPSQFVGILAGNRIEWVLVQQACNCYSMVTVPFPNSNAESMKNIIQLCELKIIIVETISTVKEMLTFVMNMHFFLHLIVVMDKLDDESINLGRDYNLKVIEFSTLEFVGKLYTKEIVPPKVDDLFTITFTSGTTDIPKGIMLTHRNLAVCISSMYAFYKETGVNMNANEVIISCFPTSNAVEVTAEFLLFGVGGRVGFYSGDQAKLLNDAKVLKPTMLPLPPQFIDRFYKLTMAKIHRSPLKSYLFRNAMKAKMTLLYRGIIATNTIWDYIVFRDIKNEFGGKVKYVYSGGAPVTADSLNFLRCALGVKVFFIYGLTEVSTTVCISHPFDAYHGSVGPPLPCSIIKLADAPEQKYFVKNGCGEICVKGGNVFAGYFKNEALTSAVIDKDGWFHTGDIGTWLKNGSLKIIDRRGNIFALSNGKQIASERIESIFLQIPVIQQIFLYGDNNHDFAVAIVVLNKDLFKNWCKKKKISESDSSVFENQEVVAWIFNQMMKHASENRLRPHEIPQRITLTEDYFTNRNGLLTENGKTKRYDVFVKYRSEIESMLSSIEYMI